MYSITIDAFYSLISEPVLLVSFPYIDISVFTK